MEMWVSMEGLVVGFPESSHWKEASLPKPVRTLLTFKSAFARFSVFVEIPAPSRGGKYRFRVDRPLAEEGQQKVLGLITCEGRARSLTRPRRELHEPCASMASPHKTHEAKDGISGEFGLLLGCKHSRPRRGQHSTSPG